MEHRWTIVDPISKTHQDSFPEINPVVLQLLYNRNLKTQVKIDEFLHPDYSQDVHDPFLFKDMSKSVQRIIKALKGKEKIIVHGDYDADGVSGAAVLVSVLKIISPGADIDVYLPHREIDGYGLNTKAIKEFAEKKVQLIVTVDCGTSNVEEIELANELGIEVIITDHHMPHEKLPPAYSIINPMIEDDSYPFKKLSGAGVAFKLAQALLRTKKMRETHEKWLMDLVAIGTIGDYVSLVGENRTLTKYGLIVLQKSRRLGLQELYKVMNLTPEKINCRSVAFQLVPRINAAGRVDHANTAYRLIMSGLQEDADKYAVSLNKLNQERQNITEKMTKDALAQIGEMTPDRKILFAQNKDWPAGLVGLVASRIMDKYHRPTIIIGQRDNITIGSGRSLPEFHITNGLKQVEHLLDRYGGHRQACGFSLKKNDTVEEFKKAMEKIAEKELKTDALIPELTIDTQLTFEQSDWSLVEALDDFAPFGEGNPVPRFVNYNVEVLEWNRVGNNQKHLRLLLREDSMVTRRLIGFGFGEWADKLKIKDKLDVVYELGVNEWNGNRELQLKIVDLKRHND